MHHLNWFAVIAAALSTMVIGFIWYSPLLFAKPWTKEMGSSHTPLRPWRLGGPIPSHLEWC